MPEAEIPSQLQAFGLDVVAFDETQANKAAALRPATRALGLSLGDGCCLALGSLRGTRVVTADRAWLQIEGIDVVVVRDG